MQIAKSTDRLTVESNRLIDTGSQLILNGVPYNKENNSPVPFNIINIPSTYRLAIGKGINPGQSRYTRICSTGKNIASINVNSMVDNIDSTICYVFGCTDDDISDKLNFTVYKLKKNIDNSVNIIQTYTSTNFTNQDSAYCKYMTQDNDNIYLIVGLNIEHPTCSTTASGYSSGYLSNSTRFRFYKIQKSSMNMLSSIDKSLGIELNEGYVYNQSSTTKYYHHNSFIHDLVVMKEIPNEGLLIHQKAVSAVHPGRVSSSSEASAYGIGFYMYSFDTGQITWIDTQNTSFYNQGIVNKDSVPSNNSSSGYGIYTLCDRYIESESEYYQYFLQETDNTSSYNWKLGLGKQSKEDLLKIEFSDVTLNFETTYATENNITELPHPAYELANYVGPYATSSILDSTFRRIYGSRYRTITRIINEKEYIFVVYQDIYSSPVFTSGIYIFKVNENKTQADLISFWQAPGGYLKDLYPLNDNYEKILVCGESQYNIIIFDKITESFKISYTSNTSIYSCILTAENKLYMILEDGSIVCQDLEGAVILDFNFEKTTYNYNNADIDSYISIWSKNADDEYVATNIKLTIVGDAVWKSNGQKTLETATLASGPTNIPFTIKGQTSINVSVDAVV